MDTSQTIYILTYNTPHRKTYDTLCLLRTRGFDHVKVYAHRMTYKKRYHPLIQHRPQNIIDYPDPEDICRNFGYDYKFISDYNEISDNGVFLLCGAGLLPDSLIRTNKIINSHPGYIPYARGLDAFKWEIYYDLPIGVTTHLIGEYIDAGEIIERREIEVEEYDTFHSAAERVYQNEIDMLVGSIDKVNKKHKYVCPLDGFPVHKRMPNKYEKMLYEKFERLKKP